MDWTDILLRLLAAAFCGGLLGIERERKNRPAGFRTYILVCLGAALVMMTNLYVFDTYQTGDPVRLAAQVISGIGFLGAGTIIVTSKNRVKGLTTAAGLWAAGCMGVAIGAGFYLGAVVGCSIVFLVMTVLHSLDEIMLRSSRRISLFVEFSTSNDMSSFLHYLKEKRFSIIDLEFSGKENYKDSISILISLRLTRRSSHELLLTELGSFPGVTLIEEM